MDLERSLYDAAVNTGGWLRREKVLALGATPRMIDHRLAVGRWRHHGGAYQILPLEGPDHLRRAAVEVLPGAVLSHHAAGEINGFRYLPDGIVTVTVHSSTTHVFPGATVHRTRDLASDDVIEVDGLPLTRPARTIVDLAAVLHRKHLEAVFDAGMLDGIVEYSEVVEVAERVCRRGKRGSTVLRRALAERGDGMVRSATALERLGLEALALTHSADWQIQYPIPWSPEKRFDAALASVRVAIEWDSRRWHSALEHFESDRQRDRLAMSHGWVVARFTWLDLTRDIHGVASAIDSIVKARDSA